MRKSSSPRAPLTRALTGALALACVDAPPTAPGAPTDAPPVRTTNDVAPPSVAAAAGDAAVQRVIYDTDLNTDVDDVGALAVLHAMADRLVVDGLAARWTPGSEPTAPTGLLAARLQPERLQRSRPERDRARKCVLRRR